MGRVIHIFSRQELEENSNGEPDSSECQFIENDPEMPMAPELFIDLDRSTSWMIAGFPSAGMKMELWF